ncbi:MAG TPA: hypothetical protein VMG60_06905 [Burkholderiaceae bacterium]|nr:hypothetical protein [Burkholderiaceae bacterium]
MKPRLRSYDPFAELHPGVPRPAANDAVTPQAPLTTGNGRSVLESRYPGMVQAICLMWGYAELNAYFDRLWLADGSQTPIVPEAMSELMLLAQIHQAIVPQRPGRSLATIYGTDYTRGSRRDVWEDLPRRR